LINEYDGILAVDIGGTNVRVGIVELSKSDRLDPRRARVIDLRIWRHRDQVGSRDDATDGLLELLTKRIAVAGRRKLRLAPFVGVACPGTIADDGTIERGGQNLPGDWENPKFNLPSIICERLPTIAGGRVLVVMHNDAVVQGLSEKPYLANCGRWGVLTIGTGLGNARFSNLDALHRHT
jgi:predicted NBD/HSP70 family sugar kinase